MGPKTILLFMLTLKVATAGVITSTFGPDDSFTTLGGGQIGGGAITGNNAEMAVAFSPASDDVLTQIRVAVFSTSATTGDHDLILDLSEGPAPGAPLETFTATILDGPARIYTFNSLLQPSLVAGQTYWLVLGSNDLVDNFFGWNLNDIGLYSPIAGRDSALDQWEFSYSEAPAFEVSGISDSVNSVPEPA
jgi:hypothetical protein